MPKLTGFLIDPRTGYFGKKVIENNYQSLKALVGYDGIEGHTVSIGNGRTLFDVTCGTTARLQKNPKVTGMRGPNSEKLFVGPLFFTKFVDPMSLLDSLDENLHPENDEVAESLSEDEIEYLSVHVGAFCDGHVTWPCVMKVCIV